MRRLNRSVLSGGVVYPAGQAATGDLEAAISNPLFWDDDEAAVPAPVVADPAAGEPIDWDAKHVPELETEIEKRNADRDPDGERYIVVGGKGNKPDLVAALLADDALGPIEA